MGTSAGGIADKTLLYPPASCYWPSTVLVNHQEFFPEALGKSSPTELQMLEIKFSQDMQGVKC